MTWVCSKIVNLYVKVSQFIYKSKALICLIDYPGTEDITAVMKRRQTSTSASITDMLQLSNRMDSWLICCGSMFLLYAFRHVTSNLRSPHAISHLILKVFSLWQWIIAGVLLQYLSNLLAITLYKAERSPLPFETFQELYSLIQEGRLTLVMEGADEIPFLNISDISDLLRNGRMKLVNSTKEVEKLLLQNPSFPVFVESLASFKNFSSLNIKFVIWKKLFNCNHWHKHSVHLTESSALKQFQPCELEFLQDPSFPKFHYGFFLGPAAPSWLKPDFALITQIRIIYNHLLRSYFPSAETCFYSDEGKGLNWIQMQSLFSMLLIGYALAVAAFFVARLIFLKDLFYSKMKSKFFRAKNVKAEK